ncbi:MAG: glycosyltransferase [Bdellovibrionales bacterium]|nr:glycosyltransferase [Bdellovibrionales bacterium]
MHRFWSFITQPILDTVKPSNIIEIGADRGDNTELLLQYAQNKAVTIHVIDPVPKFDIDRFKALYGSSFQIYLSLSLEVLSDIPASEVVLIDGDHNWFTVYNELKQLEEVARQTEKDFPIVLCHDILWPYARRDLYYDPSTIPEEYRKPFENLGISPGQNELQKSGGLNSSYFHAIFEGGERNGVRTAIEDFIEHSKRPLNMFEIAAFSGLGIVVDRNYLSKNSSLATLLSSLSISDNFKQILNALEENRNRLLIQSMDYKKSRDENYLKFKDISDKQGKRIELLNSQLQELYAKYAAEKAGCAARLESKNKEIAHWKQTAENYRSEVRHFLNKAHKLEDEVYRQDFLRVSLDSQRLKNAYEKVHLYFQALLMSSRYRIGNFLVNDLAKRILMRPNRNAPWAPEMGASVHREFEILSQSVASGELMRRTLMVAKTEGRKAAEERTCSQISAGIDLNRKLASMIRALVQATECLLSSPRYRIGHSLLFATSFLGISRRHGITAEARVAIKEALNLVDNWESFRQVLNSAYEKESSRQEKIPYTGAQVRITQFTPAHNQNPYYNIIGREMQSQNWHFQYCNDPEQLLTQLQQREFPIEIVHFHQLEPYYHSPLGDSEDTAERAQKLIAALSDLKANGAKLVWTNHNPLPHDRKFSEIDKSFIRSILPLMEHVFVLGRYAKGQMKQVVPSSKVSVILHPSLRTQFPSIPEQDSAREILGIDRGTFLFGSIGHIKPYKGLETLIAAFKLFKSRNPHIPSRLLVCGSGNDPQYIESLKRMATPEISIRNEFIPDHELPNYIAALDCSVFSFRDIWASSSVVLSLSFNVPVIAPKLGCMPDYVQDRNTGFLYQHGNIEDLSEKMCLATDNNFSAHMKYMCEYFNSEHSLAKVSEQFGNTYLQIANL